MHLTCMGQTVRFPTGARCNAGALLRQCQNVPRVFNGMLSPLDKRIPFENHLYVAFDDSGPTMQVPAESAEFLIELLTRMHNNELGMIYETPSMTDDEEMSVCIQ